MSILGISWHFDDDVLKHIVIADEAGAWKFIDYKRIK